MGVQGSRRYDWETKAAAVRDHVDNGLTVTKVMAKYDVASVAPLRRWCREWIGYNVLDWFMRDMTTKGLIIMADPNRPRHYEEEFKRRIVQS